jgi:flagellar hook-basal body complex protein FliE
MAIQAVGSVAAEYLNQALKNTSQPEDNSFQAIFKSAMDLIQETNDFQSTAEAEELNMALGYTDNTHDLTAALRKAELAIQYTVAVKNKVLEAYQSIMSIQV